MKKAQRYIFLYLVFISLASMLKLNLRSTKAAGQRCIVFTNTQFHMSDKFQCKREWSVGDASDGMVLANFLVNEGNIEFTSTTSAKKAIRRGLISVNDMKSTNDCTVFAGDIIRYFIRVSGGYEFCSQGPVEISNCEPTPSDVKVVWEDGYFAVVCKPQGMPIFPVAGMTLEDSDRQSGSSLQSKIMKVLQPPNQGIDAEPLRRPQIVHRLDQATGGLVVVAKTRIALVKLSDDFASRRVFKKYRCIVPGYLDGSGSIDSHLSGKAAQTSWTAVLQSTSSLYGHLTTVDVFPKSGRNHQIRRHLDSIGHPIMGDTQYWFQLGGRSKPCEDPPYPRLQQGQPLYLWAVGLVLAHPITGEEIRIEIPEPPTFSQLRDQLS